LLRWDSARTRPEYLVSEEPYFGFPIPIHYSPSWFP
jgi:hypothetical protein